MRLLTLLMLLLVAPAYARFTVSIDPLSPKSQGHLRQTNPVISVIRFEADEDTTLQAINLDLNGNFPVSKLAKVSCWDTLLTTEFAVVTNPTNTHLLFFFTRNKVRIAKNSFTQLAVRIYYRDETMAEGQPVQVDLGTFAIASNRTSLILGMPIGMTTGQTQRLFSRMPLIEPLTLVNNKISNRVLLLFQITALGGDIALRQITPWISPAGDYREDRPEDLCLLAFDGNKKPIEALEGYMGNGLVSAAVYYYEAQAVDRVFAQFPFLDKDGRSKTMRIKKDETIIFAVIHTGKIPNIKWPLVVNLPTGDPGFDQITNEDLEIFHVYAPKALGILWSTDPETNLYETNWRNWQGLEHMLIRIAQTSLPDSYNF